MRISHGGGALSFASATAKALLRAWALVFTLALLLGLIRLVQLGYHWPKGFDASWRDLGRVIFQGARFDLKAGAVAAILLLLPLAFFSPRHRTRLATAVTGGFAALGLVNLHYFGFYKTPIDDLVFGLVEDDTTAIFQTIWRDFPVFPTLAALAALTALGRFLYLRYSTAFEQFFDRKSYPTGRLVLLLIVGALALLLTAKGTLRAMALSRQNATVSQSPFLNDTVLNGPVALHNAWMDRKRSVKLENLNAGLQKQGFKSPLDAARVLGIEADEPEKLQQQLLAGPENNAVGVQKNLVFFLMESWSAEPLLYQAEDFDVAGRLAPAMRSACHFSNFDSAQNGTHPTLEALLFSTPITPLTLGKYGSKPLPWAIPQVMRQAGYHTVFLTSGLSGWRSLGRTLETQGFDEIVDATRLSATYPEAELGIWGVWDGYLFRYLSEHLQAREDKKPLFVFVLTTSNHPPYDLPSDYKPVARNMDRWGGERESRTLLPNLDTYHYATDLLGDFVNQFHAKKLDRTTILAATGDHNVRSFGIYAAPERQHLRAQVPFMVWGKNLDCGKQLAQPASHRDVFPTLLPLAGVTGNYVKTGRNLFASPGSSPMEEPRAASFTGKARNAVGTWTLGDPASFVCHPEARSQPEKCVFTPREDELERAKLGLLDWFVRYSVAKLAQNTAAR